MSLEELELSVDDGSPVELFLFETADGLYRYSYTTDSRPYTIGPITYTPENITRDELKQNSNGNNETLSITVNFDNPVAQLHVPYLPPKPVKVTIFRYQRFDVGVEVVKAFSGEISSFAHRDDKIVLACAQITDRTAQNSPWAVYGPRCIWALYGFGCFVSKEAFKTTADVLGVASDVVTSAEAGTKPDGWFTNGFAVHRASGETRFITKHVGTAITVIYPFSKVVPGSEIDMYAGCERTRPTCRDKFDNTLNRVAFEHIADHNVFATGVK